MAKWCKINGCWCEDTEDAIDVVACDLECEGCEECEEVMGQGWSDC